MHLNKPVMCVLIYTVLCKTYCIPEPIRTFHLIKRCQRSRQSMVTLENVASLNECFELAEHSKALALNYSPLRSMKSNLFQKEIYSNLSFRRHTKRRHFLQQPEEFFNCHALQCPESSDFSTMVNDSRFDYYSLYGNPPAVDNFSCVPEIGIFQLHLSAKEYTSAYKFCNKITIGALAHVASQKRTNALSKLLQGTDFNNGILKLAYVGLNYTGKEKGMFKTSENEDLSCFPYRAWAPGHPKTKENFSNLSCVAITTEGTWMSIDCNRKLSFICEIYTSPINMSLYVDACDGLLNDK